MPYSKTGPFIFSSIVIVGCLATGVGISMIDDEMPSLVISVIFACGTATLLYTILGGVGEAGFNLGPLKLGGSAAVLIGGAYLFDLLLEPQLKEIRDAKRADKLESMSFDFNEHVSPAQSWFAVDRVTGEPIAVEFKDPTGILPLTVVSPHDGVNLRLKIDEGSANRGYLVSGFDAESGLGYLSEAQLSNILGSRRDLEPSEIYGPKRLHLTHQEELPADKPRSWGLDECIRNMLPIKIRVDRFYESATVFEVTACDATAGTKASLIPGESDLFRFEINGRYRAFSIGILAANHTEDPYWSSFFVIEMIRNQE